MRLNGKVTNPGEMNTAITLYKRSVSVETGGFRKTATGDKIADVWARWTGVHGAEAWTAAQTLGAVRAATVLMSYRSDVDETCLVMEGTEVWEIITPLDDIGKRRELLEFNVKRVVSG